MQVDWSALGAKSPTALVKARTLAHHAVQWIVKAARANSASGPDAGQATLVWDRERGAFFTQALTGGSAEVRVGLRLGRLALILLRAHLVLDEYEVSGRRDSMVGVWLDSALRALGLKPAGGITLPYTIPSHQVARGSPYALSGELESFDELARWFGAAADLLEQVTTDCANEHAQLGAVICSPHHFDMTTLIAIDDPLQAGSRSVRIGFSAGDHYFQQPYVFVSPTPHPPATALPALPAPGHWHTQGLFAAVITGEQIVALPDARAGALNFVRGVYDFAHGRAAA